MRSRRLRTDESPADQHRTLASREDRPAPLRTFRVPTFAGARQGDARCAQSRALGVCPRLWPKPLVSIAGAAPPDHILRRRNDLARASCHRGPARILIETSQIRTLPHRQIVKLHQCLLRQSFTRWPREQHLFQRACHRRGLRPELGVVGRAVIVGLLRPLYRCPSRATRPLAHQHAELGRAHRWDTFHGIVQLTTEPGRNPIRQRLGCSFGLRG